LAYLLVKLLWRGQWHGWLPLADSQGAVIVLNHRSSVDPFFIQTLTGRKIHWMVAREYCEQPILGCLLRTCEVIPVGRGGIDTAATKAALRIVSAGGLVGMFPEGRINMTDDLMLPGRPGAAHVALKAGVPLVPCYVEGSPYNRVPASPFFMPARTSVRIGQPLNLAEYRGREDQNGVVDEAMSKCLAAIAELAGRRDFRPRLAGRNWKPTAEELAAAMEAGSRRSGR
jgi:1-acyl-sn-glycerol-3-phosphate acyltransferase